MSLLTSPFGATLSPASLALAISSEGGGSDAITFMSGSGNAGSTISGSSPGCQRSMPSTGPPSDELPKNRLAVLTLKPSRDGAGSIVISEASGVSLRSSSGRASSDNEMSYCANGGAFNAA